MKILSQRLKLYKYLENFEKNYNKSLYDEASSKIKEMKFYTSIENDFKRNL